MNVNKEQENFCHVGFAIVGTCTTILRDILLSYILPADISNKVNLGHPVWRRLNRHQQSLISRASIDGYQNFDISLLYVLLRNVCTCLGVPQTPPTKGWGKDPTATDINMSDDIERIRILRNEIYGHLPQASIPSLEFNDVWRKLQDISQRMQAITRSDYPGKLGNILSMQLTNDGWKELKDLISKNQERDEKLQDHNDKIDTLHSFVTMLTQETAAHDEQLQSNEERFRAHSSAIRYLQNRKKSSTFSSSSTSSSRIQGKKFDDLLSRMVEINLRETRDRFLSYTMQTKRISVEYVYVPLEIKEDNVPISNDMDLARDTSFRPRYGKRIKTPQELFYQNGKLARYVFLTGLAGHGKSVYCLWIIYQWCMMQIAKGTERELSETEQGFVDFDFVFFILLKDVDKSRKTVEDMLCYDVYMNDGNLHKTIRNVLCSDQYRCMIILDGLDEWRPSEGVKHQLAFKGMPSVENISESIFIFATRHSKLVEVKGILRECDRVFEIHGLLDNAMDTLIGKVLCNCYGVSNSEHLLKIKEMKGKVRKLKIKSLLKIPLFAILFIQILHECKIETKSATMLLAEMLDILIRRSSGKHALCSQAISNKVEVSRNSHLETSLLNTKEKMVNFLHHALSLTLFALDNVLIQKDTIIVEKHVLKEKLGHNTLKLALQSGLLSVGIDPSGQNEENIQIRFLHEMVQEFLSSICILTNDQKNYSFPTSIGTVKKIKELSNVVLFICGINPSLGCALSNRIANTIYADPDVSKSRENSHTIYKHSHEQLYQLEADFYRELESSIESANDSSTTTELYLSNVCVDCESDEGIVKNAVYHLSNSSVSILSLQLYRVSTEGEVCILNEILINYLNSATAIRSLYINGWNTNRFIEKIMISNLRTCALSYIAIRDDNLSILYDSSELPYLSNLPKLHRLELNNFDVRCKNLVGHVMRTIPFITNLPQLQLLMLKNITIHKSKSSLENLNESCPLLSNLQYLQEINLEHVEICQENPDILYSRDPSSMLPNVPDTLSYHLTPSIRGNHHTTYQHPLLLNTPKLKILKLFLVDIDLADIPLGISFNMTEILEIGLFCVNMSAAGWSKFLKSLIEIHNEFQVTLEYTNVSKQIISKIRSSSHFEEQFGSSQQRIEFKRNTVI